MSFRQHVHRQLNCAVILSFLTATLLLSLLGQQMARGWIDGPSGVLQAEEERNLATVTASKALFLDGVFASAAADAELLASYVSAAVNASEDPRVAVQPPSYYVWGTDSNGQLSASLPSSAPRCATDSGRGCWHDPPGGVQEDANGQLDSTAASGYFLPGLSRLTQLSSSAERRVNGSALADVAMKAMLETRAGDYYALYVGWAEDGLFRTFPYQRKDGFARAFPSQKPGSELTTATYDPRQRIWYHLAETAGRTVFTPPYSDANSGQLLITVASPLKDEAGRVVAVAGIDLSIASVQDSVLQPILTSGYGFLMDGDDVIVHPLLDTSAGVQTVQQLEFEAQDAAAEASRAEWRSFQSILARFRRGSSGQYLYVKGGREWRISYSPVASAGFALALVVPQAEIEAAGSAARGAIVAQMMAQLGVFLCMTATIVALSWPATRRVVDRVLLPIAKLREVTETINAELHSTAEAAKKTKAAVTTVRATAGDSSAVRLDIDIDALVPLQSASSSEVLLLRETFLALISALRFGNDAFDGSDLDAAYAMYRGAHELFTTLGNAHGVAVAAANLAATLHRQWHQQQAEAARRARGGAEAGAAVRQKLLDEAEVWYCQSIDAARAEWRAAAEHSSSGSSSSALADRLAQRLYYYGLLLRDKRKLDAARKMIGEALEIDGASRHIVGTALRSHTLFEMEAEAGRVEEAVRAARELARSLAAADGSAHAGAEESKREEAAAAAADSGAASHVVAPADDDAFSRAVACAYATIGLAELQAKYGRQAEARRALRSQLTDCRKLPAPLLARAMRTLALLEVDNRALRGEMAAMGILPAASGAGGGAPVPKDVTFVIDYSGSMAGGKMRRSRDNMLRVYRDFIVEEDRIALVRFSDDVTTVLPLQRKSLFQRQQSEALLSLTKPTGQTAFFDALGRAIELTPPSHDRQQWLLMITDGADTCSKEWDMETLYNTLQTLPISVIILSIGVDDMDAVAAMMYLTSAPQPPQRGIFLDVRQSEEIDQAFTQVTEAIAAGPDLAVETY